MGQIFYGVVASHLDLVSKIQRFLSNEHETSIPDKVNDIFIYYLFSEWEENYKFVLISYKS